MCCAYHSLGGLASNFGTALPDCRVKLKIEFSSRKTCHRCRLGRVAARLGLVQLSFVRTLDVYPTVSGRGRDSLLGYCPRATSITPCIFVFSHPLSPQTTHSHTLCCRALLLLSESPIRQTNPRSARLTGGITCALLLKYPSRCQVQAIFACIGRSRDNEPRQCSSGAI
jgi:hypothetical protein